MLNAYRLGGGGALAHQARGRASNNRIRDEVRVRALELVRATYADFGPTLAAEMLAEQHGLRVSRETLRGWMIDAGLWLSRRQRRRFHQPRQRREALGELVQIDGSEHRWFEDRADPCTLLVFVDDASGRLMQLRFVRSETAFAYFAAHGVALERVMTDNGYAYRSHLFRDTMTVAQAMQPWIKSYYPASQHPSVYVAEAKRLC